MRSDYKLCVSGIDIGIAGAKQAENLANDIHMKIAINFVQDSGNSIRERNVYLG